MATLQTLAASRTLPKSGPFPPPELPGFDGTMSLSDSPRGPACPSRASGWKPCFSPRLHRLGSPVLRRSSCSDMPSSLPRWDRRRLCCSPVSSATAAFPIPLLGRLPHYLFRGLLDVHSRYGLSARESPKATLFHRRLQPPHCRGQLLRLLPAGATPCRVGFAPTEDRHLSRRTKGTDTFSIIT